MRIADDPTSQKNVDTGDASHNRGKPFSQLCGTTRVKELTNDEQTDIKMFLGDCPITKLNWLWGEFVDSSEPTR
jgi:hypothetical protein